MKLMKNILVLALIAMLVCDMTVEAKKKDDKKKKGKKDRVEKEKEENEMADEEKYLVTKSIYFDMEIDDEPVGKIVIALFGEAAPNTCNNFLALAKGNYRGEEGFGYKGSLFHRVVQDFVIQGGDITVGDGSGGKSIYGPSFMDEDFIHSHAGPGYVSMANRGPDTNSSQFFILLTKARHLDNKHVVFGKVVEGMDVAEKIGDEEINEYAFPKKLIRIADSGVVKHKPYVLSKEMRK